MKKNYYKILEVAENASQDEIKKAYKTKAQQYHPDKPDGDADKFVEISEAYRILSDPDLRAAFDAGEDVSKQQEEKTPEGEALKLLREAILMELTNPSTFKLSQVSSMLENTSKEFSQQVEELSRIIQQYRFLQVKISRDSPELSLASLIEEKIAKADKNLEAFRFLAEATMIASKKALSFYEITEQAELTHDTISA